MGSNKIAETILPGSKKGMPVIGFGTAEYPFGASSAEIMNDSILHAIKLGYRHFDTASVYQSEPPLGDALSNALNLNLIDSRDELFVTSKLWISDAHPDRVLPALRETLRNLKLEYVDLYLVHWPLSMKPGKIELEVDKDDLLPLDYKSVWEAVEECQRLGLAKSIGVSNFSPEKIDILLANAKITPAVNQVEMNPVWQQKKLRDYCKEKGIHISAYSPLGAKGTAWGSNLVMDSDVLQQIASAKGKSVAQVCIRWIYQQGASAIVKSFNKERMKENMEIFDWELSPQDLEKISQIPQRKAHSGHDFVSENGPYTTFQELWDEDIYPS